MQSFVVYRHLTTLFLDSGFSAEWYNALPQPVTIYVSSAGQKMMGWGKCLKLVEDGLGRLRDCFRKAPNRPANPNNPTPDVVPNPPRRPNLPSIDDYKAYCDKAATVAMSLCMARVNVSPPPPLPCSADSCRQLANCIKGYCGGRTWDPDATLVPAVSCGISAMDWIDDYFKNVPIELPV
jgi:hypothetical protein